MMLGDPTETYFNLHLLDGAGLLGKRDDGSYLVEDLSGDIYTIPQKGKLNKT